jgi:hypothetical protein
MGEIRALEIGRGLHAIVADVPLSRYDEAALNRKLSDLDWVSRAAVAHEAVIEHFIDSEALLPMKLFTIFSSDERALEHLRGDRSRIDGIVKRVARHQEWGVRVFVSRTRKGPRAHVRRGRRMGDAGGSAGSAYLTQKKVQRDVAIELASHAKAAVDALYEELSTGARRSSRRAVANSRPASQGAGSALLLDAAFLVPRTRTRSFRAMATRRARALAPQGYAVTLSGPWPPYTFVHD